MKITCTCPAGNTGSSRDLLYFRHTCTGGGARENKSARTSSPNGGMTDIGNKTNQEEKK